MKKYIIIILSTVAALWSSCVQEPLFDDQAKGDVVSIGITNRMLNGAQGIAVAQIRFLAFDGRGNSVLNRSGSDLADSGTTAGEGRYEASLPTGTYDFFVLVNEPADVTSILDGVTKRSDLDAIKIQAGTPFTEANTPLMQRSSIRIRNSVAGSTIGEVSTDGGASWSSEFAVQLERLYAKTSLFIKKNTANAADAFTIKKVELVNIPAYSYLITRHYDGTDLHSRVMYEHNTGISFTANSTAPLGTEVVASVPTAPNPSNIFPEYQLTVPTDVDKAMYYLISAQYKEASGATFDVAYKIPLRRNLLIDNYSLNRNDHYEVTATITKRGEMDGAQINYTVRDWSGRDVSVDINKDPFLDVSNIEVNAYDAAMTRVYFYTNQPASQVYVKEQLSVGSRDGNMIAVKDVFHDLVDEGGNAQRNFTYTVDPVTGLGEGYIDIVNLNTTQAGTARRVIYLKSGMLERAITVNSIISQELAKQNATPYVGTFHRNDERGERIVTWHAEGDWQVEIVTTGTDSRSTASASNLRIDRFASPAYYSGGLYVLSPMDAEGAYVTDASVQGKLYGRGRVYFRVGWDSYSTPDSQRHAQLKVTYQSTLGGPELTTVLYCRQGEEPDRMASTDVRFAAFNVDTPETFVTYPSMSGNLYQWNKTKPWPVAGVINAYPSDAYNPSYNSEQYVCPPKYAYPDQTALSELAASLTPTSYQWGYYADGYFDRRAVDKHSHSVTGRSGELASAGGLIHPPGSSVGIFLPTADWRNLTGTLTSHGQKGASGHYWSAVMNDVDGNSVYPHDAPGVNAAIALHLTPNDGQANGVNRLEYIHKASAMSVRCMRVEGNTFYFDTNGGKSAPRSITATKGSVVRFPAQPQSPDVIFEFDKWYDNPEGFGTGYLPGEEISMTNQDKTWYAIYKKTGFKYNGNAYLLSPELGSKKWVDAVATCEAYEGGTKGWMLPEVNLLVSIFTEDNNQFPNYREYWSSTQHTTTTLAYYLSPAFSSKYTSGPKTEFHNVRCVKKLN